MNILEEIEKIKQLKARYFRLMDVKNWDEWRDIFTIDVIGDYGESEQDKAEGVDELVRIVRNFLNGATTIHHGHMPEIEIIDENTAKGIWAMEDIVDHPEFYLKGYGHYYEEYKKMNGKWKISAIKLIRLKYDMESKC